MARRSWFDPAGDGAPFDGSVARLESWQAAMADGVIEPHELEDQKERVLGLLREIEPELDDALHEKVTRVLEELTVLQAMHATLLVDEFGGAASRVPSEAPERAAETDKEGGSGSEKGR
jgi:hypothetical protein